MRQRTANPAFVIRPTFGDSAQRSAFRTNIVGDRPGAKCTVLAYCLLPRFAVIDPLRGLKHLPRVRTSLSATLLPITYKMVIPILLPRLDRRYCPVANAQSRDG